MKKIIIKNRKFPYDIGCRMLKLVHTECPFEELAEFWDSIKELTFGEIAALENLEDRRVGMLCFGLERLIKQVKPVLADTKTLKKTTTWINEKGETETFKFRDTYELYTVSCEDLNTGMQSWNKMVDVQFLKFKDTSTDREYLLWIDNVSVAVANDLNKKFWPDRNTLYPISAIQAIAWTITTTVPFGQIEKIIRQGDCILIKPLEDTMLLPEPRHLTEKEYTKFLVLES